MPNTYQSMGCLPRAGAVNSVTKDDLRRLTYRTTSGTGVPGRVMSEEDKWENFVAVHDIGKKDSKYMKFQKNTAPLLDRSACTNRRDFVELPLGDNVINTALATSFKGGVNAGNKGLDVTAKADSMYKSAFGGYTGDRLKGAKQKSVKPKASRTQTITGMTDLMETRPSSHISFATPHAELAAAAEIMLAKNNLGLSGKWEGPPPKTSYKSEFGRQYNRTASATDLRHLVGFDGSSHPSGLLPDDHPAFTMRRCSYMSPGQ
mmetsp:Transcript_72720/g.187614  ORF Transcript_72720/g.187614 Transcript_72720/m.187614 type:complete len:261 (+) Transcript_72720:126-908(+)